MASLPLIRYSATCVRLLRDPFTDIGQAVSEFGSVRFVECWEFYGLPVCKKEIPEIEPLLARFPLLSKQARCHVTVLFLNSSAA